MFIQSCVVYQLLVYISLFLLFRIAKASQQQRTTAISDPAQYLATAAASNKLGECLPSSPDQTHFHCFARLRTITTGTASIKNEKSLKYVHNSDECQDNDVDDCPGWAQEGECEINPAYMLVNCRYSCKVCSDIVDGHGGTTQVAPGSPETRQRIVQHITGTANYIRTTIKKHPNVRPTCRNHLADCTYRAVQGQCISDAEMSSYMHEYCPAACRVCV